MHLEFALYEKWVLRSRDARPAPPRTVPRKNGLPRPAKSKPCPAPQELTKPAGRSGAKLTIDYTDYAH